MRRDVYSLVLEKFFDIHKRENLIRPEVYKVIAMHIAGNQTEMLINRILCHEIETRSIRRHRGDWFAEMRRFN